MDSKVLKNILFYGIGDFIVTGVTAFLFIPLYIKFLPVADYGIFNILNNNTVIFTYIFQFGIISAFARIFFIKKNEGREKEYIWNIILFHFGFSIVILTVIFLFRQIIFNTLSPSIMDKKLLFYPVAMAFITFLPALYYILLRIEERALIFVRYQLLNVILISVFISLNLFYFKINLYTILICFIITNLTIWITVLIRFLLKFRFDFALSDIVETVKFGFPIFVSYIAYFFISKYSIVVLQKHISLSEIGMFSLALQISSIPSLITIAITKAAQPYLFGASSTDELKSRAQNFDYNYKLIMIWVVGCLIFVSDVLFAWVLPLNYYPIHNITKYLLLIILVYNFSIVENSILLYFMKSKTILAITIVGSLLNIVLSNILVGYYSIGGILVSMGIAFIVNFGLDVYFSGKYVKLSYNLKTLIPALLIIISFLILSVDNLVPIYKSYQLYFAIIYFIALTTFIGMLLKKTKNDFIFKTDTKS